LIVNDIDKFNAFEEKKRSDQIKKQHDDFVKFRKFIYSRQIQQQEAVRKEENALRHPIMKQPSAQSNPSKKHAESNPDKSDFSLLGSKRQMHQAGLGKKQEEVATKRLKDIDKVVPAPTMVAKAPKTAILNKNVAEKQQAAKEALIAANKQIKRPAGRPKVMSIQPRDHQGKFVKMVDMEFKLTPSQLRQHMRLE
jgi:hypothetical protein